MSTEPIDLVTLRVVIAAADHGSISAASQRADLALGAASARIAALEASIGTALFERSSRGVRLTPAGHLLVERGRLLLADAQRLGSDLSDLAIGLQGGVRVLANASAMIEVLPSRLASFAASHPLVRVELEERTSPEIPLALLEGRADLGIVDLTHPLRGLQFENLFGDTLVLVVPAAHGLAARREVAFEVAFDEQIVALYEGNAISARLAAVAMQQGRTLNTRLRMRSFDAVCRMVDAGLGVGVLPAQAIAPQLAALDIVALRLTDPWASRTHRLVMRADVPVPASTLAFAQALRSR